MSHSLNAISDRAFILAGLPKVDFAEESDQAALAVETAEMVVDGALSRQEWSFNTEWFQLTRDDTRVARDGYAYAFNLPGDRLGTGPLRLQVDPNDRTTIVRNFGLVGRFLCTDEPVVWGKFSLRVDPDLWPPIFMQAVVMLLASYYCLSAAQKADLAAEYERKAVGSPRENGMGGLMGQAASMDAAATANREPIFTSDPLNDARVS